MEEYIITIKTTIVVPTHEEALKVQQALTRTIANYMIEDISPISKVTTSMKEL